MILRVFVLLARPARQGASALVLPVVAFACVAALLGIVLGGARQFWSYDDELAALYQGCAIVALVLLTVPLVSLGGAAARLSTRRRDDRLAILRLLGASGASTAALAVLEAALLAFAGAVAGVLVALAVSPLVGMIPFRGSVPGAGGVMLPLWGTAGIVAGVTAISAISAAISLRRVIISPLGVALKQSAPRIPWLPALLAVGGIVLASAVMGNLASFGSAAVIVAAVGIALATALFAIDVIGTWLVGVLARGRARRAQTPARLLGARAILESPRSAWRQVSGVAMASFMAVFAGSGIALLGMIEGAAEESEIAAHLVADLRTGIVVTVIGTFVMVACGVGVSQAAQILDRRDVGRALEVMGTPLEVQDRARRDAAMRPLLLATVGPAVLAGTLIYPVVGGALILAPVSLAVILSTLVLGVAIVAAALQVTRPLLRESVRVG